MFIFFIYKLDNCIYQLYNIIVNCLYSDYHIIDIVIKNRKRIFNHMNTQKKIIATVASIVTPLTMLMAPQAVAQSSTTNNVSDPKPITEPLVKDKTILDSGSFSTVNQGDMINNLWNYCTVGYVDKMNRRLYTAKHCFDDGETVYLKNSIRKVGTSHYVKPSENISGEKVGDFAYILLDSSINAGSNIYSGDNLDQTWDTGETIHNYSRKIKKTVDGTMNTNSDVSNSYGPKTFKRENIDPNIPSSQSGDSGGPVWSNEGLVGIIKGHKGHDLRFTKLPSQELLNNLPQGESYNPSQSPTIRGLSSLISNGQMSSALSSF